MPYPGVDYAWEMVIAFALLAVAGRTYRVVSAGVLVFAVTATVAVLVPSPLGGNVGRIEDVLALPLAVGMLWPERPVSAPGPPATVGPVGPLRSDPDGAAGEAGPSGRAGPDRRAASWSSPSWPPR